MIIAKSPGQIIEEVVRSPTKEDQIRVLREYGRTPFIKYMMLAIDPNVKWALPPGAPNYEPCKEDRVENVLYNEFRRMYIFLEGGNKDLQPGRREVLFQKLLESMSEKDVRFLVDVVKDRKLPIDENIIREAYGWPLVERVEEVKKAPVKKKKVANES